MVGLLDTRSSPADPLAPVSILVVNDDVDGLFLLTIDLKRAFPEAKVLTARNGMDALALWGTEPIHAVITDNRMPQITGIMLARKIRESDSKVPIVMVTCAAEVREEALRAGVTLFTADNRLGGIMNELRHLVERSRPG